MKERAKNPADTMSADPPPAGQAAEPEPTVRGRGGAPKGNVNAAKDPAFTLAMREAQKAAKRQAQRRRAGHHADGRRVVEEAGLADSPLGARIAARLGDVENELDELRRIVSRVGRTRRTGGELTPAYERYLGLQGQDRAELRALVDRLAEVRGQTPPAGDTEYVVRFEGAADPTVMDQEQAAGQGDEPDPLQAQRAQAERVPAPEDLPGSRAGERAAQANQGALVSCLINN